MTTLQMLVQQVINNNSKLLISKQKESRRYAEILKCSACGSDKHRDEFYSTYDGRKDSRCKECVKLYMRTKIRNRSRAARVAAKRKAK